MSEANRDSVSDANRDSVSDANRDSVSEANPVSVGEANEPLVTVLKGAPTDADLAALVAVLTAAAGSAPASGPKLPADDWGNPTLMHRGAPAFTPYQFPDLSHLRG